MGSKGKLSAMKSEISTAQRVENNAILEAIIAAPLVVSLRSFA